MAMHVPKTAHLTVRQRHIRSTRYWQYGKARFDPEAGQSLRVTRTPAQRLILVSKGEAF